VRPVAENISLLQNIVTTKKEKEKKRILFPVVEEKRLTSPAP